MIAALAVLAALYTRFALTTAVAASVHEDRLRAEGLISAAVEVTAYQLTATFPQNKIPAASTTAPAGVGQPPAQAIAPQMPTSGAFSFRLGAAGITVDYRSESARIDLNVAQKELIAGLFRTLGAQPDEAGYYADRIVGWRKKGELGGENQEASAYRVGGIPYAPRQAPFQSAAELWLVLGIPPVLKERALPFLTVYSGQSEVDAENAAPEVLASLPNMTSERLGNVLQQRAGPAPLGQNAPNPAAANSRAAAGGQSHSYRLNIRLALG